MKMRFRGLRPDQAEHRLTQTAAFANCAIDALGKIGVKRNTMDLANSNEITRLQGKNGAPGGTRTPDLLVRSQTLYPTELRARGVLILAQLRWRRITPNGRDRIHSSLM
jgi:hypothetical protein